MQTYLKPLDRQQAFDTAIRGLFAQGEGSFAAEGGCAYRGVGGAKCGVGFLLPDVVGVVDNEGTITATQLDRLGNSDITSLIHGAGTDVDTAELFEPWAKDAEFLSALQNVHDHLTSDVESAAEWRRNLLAEAQWLVNRFGLDNAVVLELSAKLKS